MIIPLPFIRLGFNSLKANKKSCYLTVPSWKSTFNQNIDFAINLHVYVEKLP